MSGIKRSHLTRVEIYDGDAKRPRVNQLTGVDSTTSQAFYTNRFSLTTASVAEALPDKAINPGIRGAIKASVNNTENVNIGNSTFSAHTNSTSNVTLLPGESIVTPVDNFNRVFMYTEFATTSIELTLV